MNKKLIKKICYTMAIIIVFCVIAFYLFLFYSAGVKRERRREWNKAVKIPIVKNTNSLDVIDNEFMHREAKCPYCGGDIKFMPVSPAGERLLYYTTCNPVRDGHFYAWCRSCSKKRLPFEFYHSTMFLTEAEVSWYYCTLVSHLDATELEIENDFRKISGKPLIKKDGEVCVVAPR